MASTGGRTSYRSRTLAAMRASEQRMTVLFARLALIVAGEVTRRADVNGAVPRGATFDIQQAAGEHVRRLFLGRNGRGELAGFDILPAPGGHPQVLPLSPYMRSLWTAIGEVTRLPVEQNAAQLTTRLPADVLAVMRTATGNPFVKARAQVRETAFRPNPLASYDAPHQWVDPNGYRLSDRIWNTTVATRRQLDAYLDVAIREGRGAARMAQELERFLIPGRHLQRTNAPYGTDASYDAMRLARTEISRAHAQASEVSAAMNPFVRGLKWTLSPSHPRIDICDELARGGPASDGVYPLDGELPRMGAHPNCLCRWSNVILEADQSQAILDELRADVRKARADFVNLVGPLLVEQFTQMLLRGELDVTSVLAGTL